MTAATANFPVAALDREPNVPTHELNLYDDADMAVFVSRVETAGHSLLRDWIFYAKRNLLWASGFHMIDWRTGRADPRWDEHAPIPTIYTNWARLYLKLFIAKVIEAPITWKTIPSPTTDITDVASARTISTLLDTIWQQLNINAPDNLPEALWMLGATGIIFASPRWENAGEPDLVVTADEMRTLLRKYQNQASTGNEPADEKEVADEMFRTEFGTDPGSMEQDDDGGIVIRKGRPILDWYDGFSVTPDFGVDHFEDSQFCVLRNVVTLAAAKDEYGAAADGIKSEPIDRYDLPSTRKEEDKQQEAGALGFESCILHLTHVARSPKYPRGRIAHIIQNKVMRSGDNPYNDGGIPLIRIVESPDANEIFPTCTFNDLVPLNAAINQIDQQVISHFNQTADAKWLVEEGSVREDGPDAFMQQSGPGIEKYQTGTVHPPFLAGPAPMASDVLLEKRMLIEQFKELGGLTDPNIGRPTSKATSGRAIIALQETADRLSVISMAFIEEGLSQIGRKMIHLLDQFESKSRLFRIVGRDGKTDVLSLKGVTFMAKVENEGRSATELWDVRVTIAPKMTEEQIRQTLDWYIERRILDPVRDRNVIVQALAEGRMPDLDLARSDRRNAITENEYIRQISAAIEAKENTEEQGLMVIGELVSLRPGEDHVVHLGEHYTLSKDDAWRLLVPSMRQFLVGHISKHQQTLVQSMQTSTLMPQAESPGQPQSAATGIQ